jgi:hypothetical protein
MRRIRGNSAISLTLPVIDLASSEVFITARPCVQCDSSKASVIGFQPQTYAVRIVKE